MITAATALADLFEEVTGERLQPGSVRLTGDDPVLPGRFRVGALAAASVGATTAAAAALLRDRGVDPGLVSVKTRHAAIAFRSERYLRVNGEPVGDVWSPLTGDYRASAGWVRLSCEYPHHARAAATALGAAPTREAFVAAIAKREAVAVEDAVVAAGGAAAAMRTWEAWREHPQGAAVRGIPLVTLEPLDDGVPARPLPDGPRPLSGVRVLDLTHAIAGPVCARVLAGHGADVLRVGAEHLTTLPNLAIDGGFGKHSCFLDLRQPADRNTLRGLAREADVVVQSYRPVALAGYGFGAVGAVVLAFTGAHGPLALVVGSLVLGFCSVAMPAMTSVAMASADRSLTGSASGVFNTARQSGGALGAAVLGTLSTVGTAGTGASVLLRTPMLVVAAAYLLSIGLTALCTPARDRSRE